MSANVSMHILIGHVQEGQYGTLGEEEGRMKTRMSLRLLLVLAAAVPALGSELLLPRAQAAGTAAIIGSPVKFIASIDTMKESRDKETSQLTNAQIADDVNLSASLGTNYITVDTQYDYGSYLARWVAAVRATGKHVWFRPAGFSTTPALSPTVYLSQMRQFIFMNAHLFLPGDIFDGAPEPENNQYWAATYGPNWTYGAPNAATDAFNAFLVGLKDTADQAFQQLGIYGVITTVHSTDPWTAATPQVLYPSTVQHMGNLITVDAYPDENTTDPSTAARAWVQQLATLHQARPGASILIGEMGYSNAIPVDDVTQKRVLAAELKAFPPIPYLVGLNYWVGAGTDSSGGYTHIFTGTTGAWSLRPAAQVLHSFFNSANQ